MAQIRGASERSKVEIKGGPHTKRLIIAFEHEQSWHRILRMAQESIFAKEIVAVRKNDQL